VAGALRIDPAAAEDRFARLRLISWWDQDRLARSKVVVIGAGALGNEILKTLALLGVGRVFLADLDVVENSNLSRSVLFRAADCGRPKAEVAAARAQEIYPELAIQAFRGNIVHDLGLGVFLWADVILAGLDNREARVAINGAAARAGKVWIDGAIERLDGVARVFDPATGPCYECTMSETDWKMLAARRSCALLTRDDLEQGKVPTTPTTAAVVAGIQCQEAVKLLHGLPVISGRGFVFDGTNHQSYVVEYQVKDDCPTHEPYGQIEPCGWRAGEVTVGEALDRARSDLGGQAVLETPRDLLAALECQRCGEVTPHFASLGKVTEAEGRCPRCGEMRAARLLHAIDGADRKLLDRTLAEIGIPPWDVVTGRLGFDVKHYELAGDREQVLGPLVDFKPSQPPRGSHDAT
jgi:adenylyltransferase/sulfurtransferase